MAGIGNEINYPFSMESPQIPSDDDITYAAMAFASIIFDGPSLPDERVTTQFIEDFEIGAKWMRRKMRKAYEDIPIPQGREGERSSKLQIFTEAAFESAKYFSDIILDPPLSNMEDLKVKRVLDRFYEYMLQTEGLDIDDRTKDRTTYLLRALKEIRQCFLDI